MPQKTLPTWMKMKKQAGELFDPASVRADRGNEVFSRDPLPARDYSTSLPAELLSTSPQQVEAQRQFDANMRAIQAQQLLQAQPQRMPVAQPMPARPAEVFDPSTYKKY